MMIEEKVVAADDQSDPLICSNASEQCGVAILPADEQIYNVAAHIQTLRKKNSNLRQTVCLREFETPNHQSALAGQERALSALVCTSNHPTEPPSEKEQIVWQHRRFWCATYLLVGFLLVVATGASAGTIIKHYSADRMAINTTSSLLSTRTTATSAIPELYRSRYLVVLSLNSPIYSRSVSITAEDDQYVQSNYEEVRDYYDEKVNTYYYELLLVYVSVAGHYTIRSDGSINAYGYIYNSSFDSLNPSQNLLGEDDDSGGDGQFQLTVNLYPQTTYILVTTTHSANVTGEVFITGSGLEEMVFYDMRTTLTSPSTTVLEQTEPPPMNIISRYSSTLNSDSGTYCRPWCSSSLDYSYYESIEVRVDHDADYSFTSVSDLDTYGSIYHNSFDPLKKERNLLLSDDDSGGSRQFRLQFSLNTGITYILVVTSYQSKTTGDFLIVVSGPRVAHFNRITTPRTTPTTTIQTTSPWSVESTYSSSWTWHSQMYCRTGCSIPSYYYEAVKVRVSQSETYSIASKSGTDTYGYLYKNSFDLTNPSSNLLAQDDESGGNGQFKLTHFLHANRTYILVVTTFNAYTTGAFSISASGPGSVIFHS